MPGVPIEMPSETVMVLKIIALAAGGIGALRRRVGQLVDVHVAGREHAPGRGDADLRLLEVAVVKPTARSIARLGVCLTPSNTRLEYGRGSTLRRLIVGLQRDVRMARW